MVVMEAAEAVVEAELKRRREVAATWRDDEGRPPRQSHLVVLLKGLGPTLQT